jgi:hypothetical protein
LQRDKTILQECFFMHWLADMDGECAQTSVKVLRGYEKPLILPAWK